MVNCFRFYGSGSRFCRQDPDLDYRCVTAIHQWQQIAALSINKKGHTRGAYSPWAPCPWSRLGTGGSGTPSCQPPPPPFPPSSLLPYLSPPVCLWCNPYLRCSEKNGKLIKKNIYIYINFTQVKKWIHVNFTTEKIAD